MSTYSTNLKIELIGTGEQAGTWGVTTDDNFSNVFEQSIVGRVTVPFTNADVTLTATNSVASQSFRNVYLNCTGTNTASRNLVVPTINKNYVVQNNTTGGFTVVVKTASGTGITIPNGSTCTVYADGTNVIQAFDYLPTLTVPTLNITTLDATNIEVTNIKAKDGTASATIADSTGVMTLASSVLTTTDINGGTVDNTAIGATTASTGKFTTLTNAALTATRVTYAGTAGLLQDSANLTFNGTTLTAAAITASGDIIGNGNWTLGNDDTDTITVGASFVTGSVLRSAKLATNTLALAAYDVDGVAYTNLITLTASNTPTLTLTSTGVGTINNMSVGTTTRSTGAFTTLASNGATTFTAGTASTTTTTGTAVITGGLGVSGRINAANFDGIIGANTAAAVSSTNLAYTGTLTGGTGVVNLGSGQFYKDASGRVGINVIPDSTWAAGTSLLQMGASGGISGGYISNLSSGGFVALSQNLIVTGASTYKYSTSNLGSLFYTQSGNYYWQSAPSGTAGATATLTTRMSLSAAGVLDVPNRGISAGSMPAGSVIQVVSVAYATAFSTTSATDVSTGLTASITPTSSTSKILVTITANCRANGVGGNAYFIPGIYRNTSTAIWTGFAQGGNFTSTDFRSPATITYLDSPATTSSTNYLLSLNASLAGVGGVDMNNGGGTSTITLMEIAA